MISTPGSMTESDPTGGWTHPKSTGFFFKKAYYHYFTVRYTKEKLPGWSISG